MSAAPSASSIAPYLDPAARLPSPRALPGDRRRGIGRRPALASGAQRLPGSIHGAGQAGARQAQGRASEAPPQPAPARAGMAEAMGDLRVASQATWRRGEKIHGTSVPSPAYGNARRIIDWTTVDQCSNRLSPIGWPLKGSTHDRTCTLYLRRRLEQAQELAFGARLAAEDACPGLPHHLLDEGNHVLERCAQTFQGHLLQ